jgi:hypothetical protein
MSNNGQSNGRGPPPWAGPKVEEQDDGTVRVGPPAKDSARSRAEEAGNQMDRVEAKLDLLISEVTE